MTVSAPRLSPSARSVINQSYLIVFAGNAVIMMAVRYLRPNKRTAFRDNILQRSGYPCPDLLSCGSVFT